MSVDNGTSTNFSARILLLPHCIHLFSCQMVKQEIIVYYYSVIKRNKLSNHKKTWRILKSILQI